MHVVISRKSLNYCISTIYHKAYSIISEIVYNLMQNMPLNRLLVCHAYISSIKLRQIFNSIYTPVYLENTQIPERANRAIPGTHISSRSLIHSEVREKLTLQPSSQTRLAVWVTAVIVSGPFTCDITLRSSELYIWDLKKSDEEYTGAEYTVRSVVSIVLCRLYRVESIISQWQTQLNLPFTWP